MHGLIDDFAVFGTALTQAQIQQLFTATFTSSSGSRCGGHFFTPFPSAGYLLRITESLGSDWRREAKLGCFFTTAGGLVMEVLTGAR